MAKKRKCLGGFPKGYVCQNPAGCAHTPYWCKECNEKRMAHITAQLRTIVPRPSAEADDALGTPAFWRQQHHD